MAVTGAGTYNLLYLENENTEKQFAVSFMRMQGVSLGGGVAIPSSGNYFQIGFNAEYVSNGTDISNSAVNMNQGSAKVADITAYKDNPTLNNFTEIDRWYPGDSMMAFNKHGSIIVPKNKTLTIRLVTDNTSGEAYCRATFFYLDED